MRHGQFLLLSTWSQLPEMDDVVEDVRRIDDLKMLDIDDIVGIISVLFPKDKCSPSSQFGIHPDLFPRPAHFRPMLSYEVVSDLFDERSNHYLLVVGTLYGDDEIFWKFCHSRILLGDGENRLET